MADKFQNGLYLYSSDGYNIGLVFTRWLVEWCTQVIGMTLYDSNTAGGSFTATIATGSDGASVTDQPAQFSAVSRTWTTSDVGRYVTITGMTDPSRDGIYRISKWISAGIVELDVRHSVHEDGLPISQSGLAWRLWDGTSTYRPTASTSNWVVLRGTYQNASNFDVKITCSSNSEYLPTLAIGPNATWDSGGNAWTGSFNTADRTIGINFQNAMTVFACGDKHRIITGLYGRGPNTAGYSGWMSFGEFTPNYPAVDTKPAMTWSGAMSDTSAYFIGIGRGAVSNDPGEGLRFVSADDATSVTGYLEFPCIAAKYNTNYFSGAGRRWSMWSRKIYRQSLTLVCLTTGKFERRGKMIDTWAVSPTYMKATPFGANREFLNFGCGVAFPWNGSTVYFAI